jgi:hypothetical protein
MLKDDISKLRSKGYSYNQIVDKLGCSLSVISYHMTPKGKQKKVDRQRYKRRQNKLNLVESLGGCCSKCGYNKCMDALEFHHIDPKKKEFNLQSCKLSITRLQREAKKCILVCANCHREIHAGF